MENIGGVPYVAVMYSSAKYLDVFKLNGVEWEKVGDSLEWFSSEYISLGTQLKNIGDVPYIMYKKGSALYVKKFDGTGWKDVGSPITGAGGSFFLRNLNGEPIIMYEVDVDDKESMEMQKFNGVSWKTEIVWTGDDSYTILDVHVEILGDTPYMIVGGVDASGETQVYVLKYNGSAWVDVTKKGYPTGFYPRDPTSFNNTLYLRNRKKEFIKLEAGSDTWEEFVEIPNGSEGRVMAFGKSDDGAMYTVTTKWEIGSIDPYEIEVWKLDGSSWEQIGNTVETITHDADIAVESDVIHIDGVTYISLCNTTSFGRLPIVMRLW